MQQDPDGAADRRILFDAVLHPHRSLSPRGFAVLMGSVGTVSLAVGGWFLAQGAWPVFGFFGLDVLLLYVAFRLSYRAGRMHERVRLTEAELEVQRIDHRGGRRFWRFQPSWLRVAIDDPPEHDSQVVLSSHGRSVVVGSFLSPEERLDFAHALERALTQWRLSRWRARPAGPSG
ncbi:DUF2244 domain-containing protein [Arenibaculum sp.]|jgi:uncharacterized membrane protein|uniref:DUF2244 domain-containing protein n=1 Tax=Arenibaculum sp. TaxID=2865862 RepID=UPI002E0F3B5B|nr:DUF2244 domain-containing protein [Arenibaculum sp.]